ncbi:hypothetical protein K458DRAFT_311426 [Lentithecium fluviatile CBS 122367]|uniref:Uncharacterized protein n=1 Tax=Lentithecium fluviatile CBS 122367 TaxID=1168545 RepID=A0A6G1IQV2_9PLEO|nr:hypothetical protein K458DRAFT_311426 [Lentithecium fluviatile CBS 122367]
MDSLLQTAPAGLARERAGYSADQWERFLCITRELAKALVQRHPETQWKDIPADAKDRFRQELSARLLAEHIGDVTNDLLRWRMKTCISSLSRKRMLPQVKKLASANRRQPEEPPNRKTRRMPPGPLLPPLYRPPTISAPRLLFSQALPALSRHKQVPDQPSTQSGIYSRGMHMWSDEGKWLEGGRKLLSIASRTRHFGASVLGFLCRLGVTPRPYQ